MQFLPPSISMLRIAAVTTLMAVGTTFGCDVEDADLSTEELEFIEADLEEELTVAPAEGEDNVGVDSPIDGLVADNGPIAGFLGWHSDETVGWSTCPSNQIVTGFDCSGSYCDNVRLECESRGGTVLVGGSNVEASAWFEHNGKNKHVCPAGQKITGIDCWGDNCDNISILCSKTIGLDTDNCQWTDFWYSEESPGPFEVGVNEAIQGIWCSGTNCDNKKFRVCEI